MQSEGCTGLPRRLLVEDMQRWIPTFPLWTLSYMGHDTWSYFSQKNSRETALDLWCLWVCAPTQGDSCSLRKRTPCIEVTFSWVFFSGRHMHANWTTLHLTIVIWSLLMYIIILLAKHYPFILVMTKLRLRKMKDLVQCPKALRYRVGIYVPVPGIPVHLQLSFAFCCPVVSQCLWVTTNIYLWVCEPDREHGGRCVFVLRLWQAL